MTVKRDGTVLADGERIGRVERQLDRVNERRFQIRWEAFSASGRSLGIFYSKGLAVDTVALQGRKS